MTTPHILLRRRLRLVLLSVCLLTSVTVLVALYGNRSLGLALVCALSVALIWLWGYAHRQLLGLVQWHDQVLSDATDQVERARLLESEFLANMSHELRTPLSTVIGISEMLQEEAEEQTESELVQAMRRISLSGRRLLSLLNELLDLASIESGKMRLAARQVDLAELVEEVLAEVQPLACANGNVLEHQLDSSIKSMVTDPKRLRQILIHLLGNACRFTHDGRVRFDIKPEHGSDGNCLVLFRVSDTGCGIESALIAQMRQEFSQSAGVSSLRRGGAGLRLSVCQRLGQLMNGSIDVQSTSETGSVFSFYLPRMASTANSDVWLQ